MNAAAIVGMIYGIVGGLAIFLLGMKNMSEGMQAVAGRRLRKMISVATDNRLAACGTGTAVTSLIQSSSVTTVMLVGLVNAGVMTLRQAVGVILGADLGTTVTAWIVSLNVLGHGIFILGVCGLFFLFSRNERVRYLAMVGMGIGMIFFGLLLMKEGMEPLRHAEAFTAWFSKFEPVSYLGVLKCVAVGALVTAVIQSSSATVAITITLARIEVIGFDTAVALVLGQNIGTTVTALLASLGTSTEARRVAYAHILMKVVGVLLMGVLFFGYMRLLNVLTGEHMDIAKRIAFSHTLFNVFLVCLFLPIVPQIVAALYRFVPDAPPKEVRHLQLLDIRILDTPAFGIQQSLDEIKRMSEGVKKMFDWLRTILSSTETDEDLEREVFRREELLDVVQKEIVEFLAALIRGSIPRDVAIETRKQLRMADEYESISDYLATLLKLHLKRMQAGIEFSAQAVTDILSLHDSVAAYVTMINEALRDGNAGILSKAHADGGVITIMFKDLRTAHLSRMEIGLCSARSSLIYADMLQCYRKIKNHAVNIAEAIAGEK